ncbi:hypothetical protein KM043_009960 [Ampulex compressa]|nr:hypothetical protein KM043_009960 [Ampulex compressa]
MERGGTGAPGNLPKVFRSAHTVARGNYAHDVRVIAAARLPAVAGQWLGLAAAAGRKESDDDHDEEGDILVLRASPSDFGLSAAHGAHGVGAGHCRPPAESCRLLPSGHEGGYDRRRRYSRGCRAVF